MVMKGRVQIRQWRKGVDRTLVLINHVNSEEMQGSKIQVSRIIISVSITETKPHAPSLISKTAAIKNPRCKPSKNWQILTLVYHCNEEHVPIKNGVKPQTLGDVAQYLKPKTTFHKPKPCSFMLYHNF